MIWRITALVFAGAISGTITFMLVDRDPPAVMTARPDVLNPILRPGEDLQIRYHIFRKRSCSTYVERVLYDARNVRYQLNAVDFAHLPQLGFEQFISKIPIPKEFAQGPGRYRSASTYACNMIQRMWPITPEASEILFEVRGPPIVDEVPIKIVP